MPEVVLEGDGPVATITLNAPERRNALTLEMADAFVAALARVGENRDVAALVVQARGESFCAGADYKVLSAAAADPAEAESFEMISRIYDSFFLLGQVGVPTIAAARGSCVGAGLNLLLATDLRIVARDTRLLSGFAPRGLHPGGGHLHLLARVAGRETTAAMALFGQEIDGERAARVGMAWEAVDAADVESRAHAIASSLAANPALSRRLVRTFREETESLRTSWQVAKELERPSQMWSMRNPPG
ncbi:enoyl-CoA hydratase-related protein [Dactylosporangium sp. NPDC051484]|uniref:enoyl-CoA hydratase/isomerase family protein n=1 Tax=Dactylosporangium sp. NPDC051484 TaxID=3154942 RepID=UPI00344B2650